MKIFEFTRPPECMNPGCEGQEQPVQSVVIRGLAVRVNFLTTVCQGCLRETGARVDSAGIKPILITDLQRKF